VVRAQQVPPGYAPHFSLLGLVSAGRDDGGRRFERESVVEHISALSAGISSAAAADVDSAPVQVALTPLSPAGESIAAAVTGELSGAAVLVVLDCDRQSGRGYYRELCYKLNVMSEGGWAEIGDGGFTDWAAKLTASNKERLLISGVGIDRLVALRGNVRTNP
jgi:hypothetical protein